MYYCTVSITRSPTAAWLLRSVSFLEEAYSRLQLLLTPSKFKAARDCVSFSVVLEFAVMRFWLSEALILCSSGSMVANTNFCVHFCASGYGLLVLYLALRAKNAVAGCSPSLRFRHDAFVLL